MSNSKKNIKQNTKYEICKKNIIGQDMRLFKQGKLTQRNKQPVTNPKQAIAIALSMAENKCKNKKNSKDIRKENIKIKQKLAKDKYKTPIKSADIRNIITKLKELKKNKRRTEYRTLKIDLLSRIIISSPISNTAMNEIKRYLRNEK